MCELHSSPNDTAPDDGTDDCGASECEKYDSQHKLNQMTNINILYRIFDEKNSANNFGNNFILRFLHFEKDCVRAPAYAN